MSTRNPVLSVVVHYLERDNHILKTHPDTT